MLEIKCNDLTIKYSIHHNFFKTEYVRGINKISVEIKEGERVGILGKNGSGKSTFLRTLAGVYKPKHGSLKISPNIKTLFDLSNGLDVDASAYENIKLLMTVHDIPFSEYQDLVQYVENFTELGNDLKRPVRTYSTGMKLRFIFSVSTFNLKKAILIMDEIINAGDKYFRLKAQKKINQLVDNSGILILASHSIAVLENYCQRGLVFNNGEIIFDGLINDAIKFYQNLK